MRPLIGLSTYARELNFGPRDRYSPLLPMEYVQAVNHFGGRAVLIPVDDPGADLLDHLDGILFAGGSDIDPATYGQAPHPETVVRADRDQAELLLCREALARGLPILGVCRGIQVLAVAAGGTLHQHLPDLVGHDGHLPEAGTGSHEVRTVAGSTINRIVGDQLLTNSLHHQAIDNPGQLRITATCCADGVVEAAEHPSHPFAVGVQWHPEETEDWRVFAALVAAAKLRSARARPKARRLAPAPVKSAGSRRRRAGALTSPIAGGHRRG